MYPGIAPVMFYLLGSISPSTPRSLLEHIALSVSSVRRSADGYPPCTYSRRAFSLRRCSNIILSVAPPETAHLVLKYVNPFFTCCRTMSIFFSSVTASGRPALWPSYVCHIPGTIRGLSTCTLHPFETKD